MPLIQGIIVYIPNVMQFMQNCALSNDCINIHAFSRQN